MAKIQPKEPTVKFKKEIPSAKLHNAIIVGAWPIGKQLNKFSGKMQDQIVMMFEIDEKLTDKESKFFGKRKCYIKTMALSNYESAPYKQMKDALYPDVDDYDFDSNMLLNTPCTIQIKHKKLEDGRVFANLVSVAPKIDGAETLKAENVYADTPEWIVKLREKAKPEPKIVNMGEEEDSDLPF